MPVLSSEIPTGTVTGQFYFVNEDNIDADTDPQLTAVTGTVRFTCEAPDVLRMPAKSSIVVPLVFDAEFDAQGRLVPKGQTNVGIELPASDSPEFNPTNFTWRVEFDLVEAATGYTIQINPFSIIVPGGKTSDLTALMPVSTAPGTIMTQGVQGIQGTQGVKGDTGAGVPSAGSIGYVLRKRSATSYDTEWAAANDHSHPDATTTVSGFMSAADKLKMDSITLPNNSKLDTDAPNTYPVGISIMSTTDNGFQEQYATVVTFRQGVSGRAFQIVTRATTGTMWIRAEAASNTWGAWTKNATDAVATTSANGLMSSADKTKLDAATANNTVSTIVMRDNAGRINASHMTVTNWPDGASSVVRRDYYGMNYRKFTMAEDPTNYPHGVSTFLASNGDGWAWPEGHSFYNIVTARQAFALGGTVQWAYPYNNNALKPVYRTWDQNGTAWSEWKTMATEGWVTGLLRDSNYVATGTLNGLMSAADKTKLDGAIHTATASRLMIRDLSGRAQVADPVGAADIATRGWIEAREYAPSITAGADLNTYTTPGRWNAQSSSVYNGGTNWPELIHGMLTVEARSDGASVVQTFKKHGGDQAVFTRSFYGTAWTPWKRLAADVQQYALNVKDFGAVGDGTTNDGSAIQAAVNAAVAGGQELYWPAGTYLKTVNITSFHSVQHRGRGIVKHGTDLFHVEPIGTQANTLFVSVSGASDTYDGMSASLPMRTSKKALETLVNYGPLLDGVWTVQIAAGTYTDRPVVPLGLTAINPITIQGVIVNHPNIPTTKFTEGYNIGAVALKILDVNAQVKVSNILFEGYNGTASSAGIQAGDTDEVFIINCHFIDCFWGVTNQSSSVDIKGGDYLRCGYLGSTANNVAPTSRSGNGGGYRGLMRARHSIGVQYAGVLTNGPTFRNCVSGAFVQETGTGHMDYCTFEDNQFGVNIGVNSRANIDGSSFKRNNVDARAIGNSHIYMSSNVAFGTGVDESKSRVQILSGSQLVDDNRMFTDKSQNYNTVLKTMDTVFPAQTVQTTSLTKFYTLTLAGGMWRDALNSNNTSKRVTFRVTGELAGTAGTKTLTFRLGTSTVSATFTATEVGVFEAEATVLIKDTGTQYMILRAVRHLGANVRLAHAHATNALTADTTYTAEAAVSVATDSIKIDMVDVVWG